MGDSLSEQIVIGEYQFSTKGIAHPKKHQAPQSADNNKGNPEMDQIVTREHIRALAREAHAHGVGRDDHGMNWHAAAVVDWQEEWDRCEVARLEELELERV